jgi:membrane-bound lytic murein transglycosylase D
MVFARPWLRPTGATIVLGLALAGCSAGARHSHGFPEPVLRDHRTARELPSVPDFLALPESTAAPAGGVEDVPFFDTTHPKVLRFVDKYQTSLRGFMSHSLVRASSYLGDFASILTDEGVPAELAYLPIVESGFRLNAVSRAGAVGPWQFMRMTGQRYGLRIDGYVDERRDPIRSTRAAARYLRDLYDMFGDWHLSLAAYNTGEAAIARIQERRNVSSYWEMTERGYLPRETSEFVPRFIAAMEIARAPEAYGFEVPPGFSEPFEQVHVDRSITLRTVAKLSGAKVGTIQELNPALRRGVVPPGGYPIRVPYGAGSRFQETFAALKVEERRQGSTGLTHRVRRGETPSSIAVRYKVSVRSLMQANRIRDARRLPVGSVLRIPGRGRTLDQLAERVLASMSRRDRGTRVN